MTVGFKDFGEALHTKRDPGGGEVMHIYLLFCSSRGSTLEAQLNLESLAFHFPSSIVGVAFVILNLKNTAYNRH